MEAEPPGSDPVEGESNSPDSSSKTPDKNQMGSGDAEKLIPESHIEPPIPTIHSDLPIGRNSVSNSPTPWASRLKASLRNLKKSEVAEYLEDGTPVILAPPSLILQGSENWSEYLVAKFSGDAPPSPKIYSDLNPIFGRLGNISIRRRSERTILILIPNKSTREWVLQIGYWQSGNCGFVVSEWSPSGYFQEEKLVSVPIWVNLLNIPEELYTLEGIGLIASGVGEPLHTEKSRLNKNNKGEAKVKVEIPLDRSVPDLIMIKDVRGNSVTIDAVYPRLPPKCEYCSEFGHLQSRCSRQRMDRISGKFKNKVVKQGVGREKPGNTSARATIVTPDLATQGLTGKVLSLPPKIHRYL